MEQYWIYYAIATAICIGLYGFAQKMKAEMPEQSDNWFIAYSYIAMSLGGVIGALIFGQSLQFTNLPTILYALGITSFYIVIVKTRLISLRYLSSSSYFINYRIFSSLWLVISGIFLFSETITTQEFLGILLWFFVFYLLLEKKSKNESVSDLKRWFIYLLIGSLAVTGVQTLAKSFATSDLDIYAGIFSGNILSPVYYSLKK